MNRMKSALSVFLTTLLAASPAFASPPTAAMNQVRSGGRIVTNGKSAPPRRRSSSALAW